MSDETFSRIQAALTTGAWAARVEALRDIAGLINRGLDHQTTSVVVRLAVEATKDEKWEVRKSAVGALAAAPNSEEATVALERLAADTNPWVRRAAARSLDARLAPDRASDDPELSPEVSDPLLQMVEERTRRLSLRSLTQRELFAVVAELGEHHYAALASEMSHELRTALTPLKSLLSEIDHSPGLSEIAEALVADALVYLERALGLLDDLSIYSWTGELTLLPILASDLVERAVGGAAAAVDASSLDIVVDVPRDLEIRCAVEPMVRALTNLLTNAFHADGTTSVRISACVTESETLLRVVDDGPGMTPRQTRIALERFKSTRKGRGGSGLGLPIVQKIAERHGGALRLESTKDRGTSATIAIPLRGD